jgi:transcriptional regulator with XRE-family HTH domain
MAGTREVSDLDRAAATHIRVLAAKRNMKQAEVAVAAGIATSTFNRYWNAQTSMTLGDLERVLAALGTSYAEESDEIRALIVPT